jgi:hypothetical protein
MRLWPVAIAMVGLLLAGCGGSSGTAAQQQVLAYQVQIGRINRPFAHPPTAVKASERMLATAIAAYRKLHVPSVLAAFDRSLVTSLSTELRAVRSGASATADGNSARLAAAVKSNARARAKVTTILGRLVARVNVCRNDAARC